MKDEKTEVVQRYVSLLTNSGFKAVFGDRANKDVVMSVINILLPEGKQVDDITYLQTEYQGPTLESKEFQYDFMCQGMDGTAFIVEMQCYPNDYWFKRCVSYASRAYDMQNRKGEEYDVAPVYLIGLMGTEIRHYDETLWEQKYISEYTFREKETNELQDETIFIIFAELARFDKELAECENDLEKMLYIIKNGWRRRTSRRNSGKRFSLICLKPARLLSLTRQNDFNTIRTCTTKKGETVSWPLLKDLEWKKEESRRRLP